MERIENIKQMQRRADELRKSGKRIAFVPTMGYLHEGHLSLIDIARKESDIVVVSIFVNPVQFGPNEDYDSYPRDIGRDEVLAKEHGTDILFVPDVKDMYPAEQLTWVSVNKITEVLCGARRPGHFRGVATVVSKLFNIVKPHLAVFGQKDAQQAAVIMKMADDLNMDVDIRIAPVKREADGLAMSSRNVRLSKSDRQKAVVLSQVLSDIRDGIMNGEDVDILLEQARKKVLNIAGAEPEYLEFRSYPQLETISSFDRDCLIAIAVRFGDVRLIDNVLLKKT